MLLSNGQATTNIKEVNFDRGHKVEIVPQGKGFTLALCLYNHAVKTTFKFDLSKVTPIFSQWVKDLQKMGYTIIK